MYFHICSYMFVGQTSPHYQSCRVIYFKDAESQFQQFGNEVENPKNKQTKKQVISYNVLFFDQIEKMYKSQLLFYQKDN